MPPYVFFCFHGWLMTIRYWSRRFRQHMDRKKSGRMTDIPQLGPEVYIDDADDITKQARANVSPLLSPTDQNTSRATFIAHGLDGASRHRRGESSLGGIVSPGSPGINAAMMSTGMPPGLVPHRSPQLSPSHGPHHRATNSAFSFEASDTGSNGGPSGNSSRRGSVAENVLQVLDDSAWGESIRRSFTVRRPPGGGYS